MAKTAHTGLSICVLRACVHAGGGSIFSAVTAGQSSAAAWVSIGNGCSVHYHTGVATASLPKKCFGVERRHVKCQACPYRMRREKKGIINMFSSLKSH